MEVLTVKEMRDFDALTIKKLNIGEVGLMNRAGHALVRDFLHRARPEISNRITVFAGVGNNGGDALAMAIELIKLGYGVHVMVIGDVSKAGDSFAFYLKQIKDYSTINDTIDIETNKESLIKSDLIIDGIFGVGLTRNITGFRVDLIDFINSLKCIKYSIDIPSGIHPDTGIIQTVAIKADLTGVIAYYKTGNLLNDALDYHGQTRVLDIGILPAYKINRHYIDIFKERVEIQIPKNNSNKYTVGSGVFIGGDKSMMGSIQMSAMSALLSGLGISFVYSKINDQYTQFYPELVVRDIKEESLDLTIDKAKVIVFGPGLPKNDPDYEEVLNQILGKKKPVVVDATGLTYLDISKNYEDIPIVITPHAGEMSRLLGVDTKEIILDPLKHVKTLTDKGISVILKGTATIVSDGENTYFIQAKNPGLATAGSGDVLCGIVAATYAKNNNLEALKKAVVLHSKAGMKAKSEVGVISLVASDLIKAIPEVIMEDN